MFTARLKNPTTFGPSAAGVILDGPNPERLWFICGISCLVAIVMFLGMNRRVEARAAVQPAAVLPGG